MDKLIQSLLDHYQPSTSIMSHRPFWRQGSLPMKRWAMSAVKMSNRRHVVLHTSERAATATLQSLHLQNFPLPDKTDSSLLIFPILSPTTPGDALHTASTLTTFYACLQHAFLCHPKVLAKRRVCDETLNMLRPVWCRSFTRVMLCSSSEHGGQFIDRYMPNWCTTNSFNMIRAARVVLCPASVPERTKEILILCPLTA